MTMLTLESRDRDTPSAPPQALVKRMPSGSVVRVVELSAPG